MSTELKTPLLSKNELAQRIEEARMLSDPSATNGTTDKYRWIHPIIRNRTQFSLSCRSSYFYSGRYEQQPQEVPAFRVGDFSIVNKDYSFGAGATGANAWNLCLQLGIELNLAFGFTAPASGPHSTYVVESITPKDAYDKAVENGNRIVSKHKYTGADSDEREIEISFEMQCTGGSNPIFTITQVIT